VFGRQWVKRLSSEGAIVRKWGEDSGYEDEMRNTADVQEERFFGKGAESSLLNDRMENGSNPRDAGHWVAVWAAMPQLTEEDNMPPEPFVSFDHMASGQALISFRHNQNLLSITRQFVKLYG
jgi:hypothetical protein